VWDSSDSSQKRSLGKSRMQFSDVSESAHPKGFLSVFAMEGNGS
jgi:hypothetical protein